MSAHGLSRQKTFHRAHTKLVLCVHARGAFRVFEPCQGEHLHPGTLYLAEQARLVRSADELGQEKHLVYIGRPLDGCRKPRGDVQASLRNSHAHERWLTRCGGARDLLATEAGAASDTAIYSGQELS